ncbi:MAG: hypothetical protein WC511_06010 [Candidatus Pacearchaeota archaeon]|jgi:hypothetical protein
MSNYTQAQNNRIKIANPPIDSEPRTYLTADCAIGATTISTLDNNGFVITGTSDYYIIIGEYGSEKSEIVLVDANGGGTSAVGFTVSATKYAHEASDPVTLIRFNQILFYGKTSSGGTRTLIATKDVDCSQLFTQYTYQGQDYSFFDSAFYNSTDDKISVYSDEINATSYTRQSIKRIIESGLRKALTELDDDPNSQLNWDIAIETVQDGIDEIIAKKRRWPFLRTISTSISTVASQNYIEKPTDLLLLEYIKVDGIKINTISRNDYNNYTASGAVVPTGKPTGYVFKNNKIYLYPTPDSIYTVTYEYYKIIAEITSDLSTEIDFPFVPVLIYYTAAQFAYIRGNDKRGDKMYSMFLKLLDDQIIEYSGPEQTGDAESVDRTSYINDDGDGILVELE